MLKKIIPVLLAGLAAAAAEAGAADPLRDEPSAFISTYRNNPVDWLPWGEAAFVRAKSEQKPVFLFIGSFTSELAGAMRRQTFANAKNADWLNQNFVCVIVDRDERPDVAALYQAYVSNLKQLSGWPLNIWLTPEFQPYEGATYLSPSEDWGAPGFLKLANQAKNAWSTNPAGCRKRAAESVAQLIPSSLPAPLVWNGEKTRSRLAASAAAWRAAFDPAPGGYGDVPRSPEPELIRFMLLGAPDDRATALKTLKALASSAVRDPLDGGFFRHGADPAWHIPYQQKTLSDQARIALAFLAGTDSPDRRSFEQCARGALDFALTRFAQADGTFAASEDATADDYSGYYLWTAAQIDGALGADADAFKSAHGVKPEGNVPAADDPSALYVQKNVLRSLAETDSRQAAASTALLALRDRRPAPPKDPRATAGAHGLLLDALARAGLQLKDPGYVEAARRTLDSVRKNFLASPDGGLRRLKDSKLPAAAEDYAAVALGCRAYARASGDKEADALAGRLLQQMEERFYDSVSGALLSAPAQPGPGFFFRPLSAGDAPSSESIAVLAQSPHARSMAAALSDSLEESSAQAPGDLLLALKIAARRELGQ